uniref:Dynein light chain n=1 Tax=Varanus komodoensis TaxID=61221 RepID=A0A8D2LW39_VARKO
MGGGSRVLLPAANGAGNVVCYHVADVAVPCVFFQHTDMPEEMRVEAMELCVTACEKYATNNESAAKMIKETMDKKFGSSWHVVIGEGFGFEITHEVKNLLYMFFGGSLAVCVWKCS